ncbi:MAG: EamA family transporter [Aigarchaeota archaeon]|nr:EamA family transporter [Aigarchaeota archaeon]MDH5703858.1 EamA family transporter [Aigarchaeota archaeon]
MWIALALLSAFFAALVAIFGKLGLKGVDSTVATGMRALVMAAFMVSVVAVMGKMGEMTRFTGGDMGLIVLSGVSGALSWVFYFAALKIADASKVAPLDRSSVLIVILLSAIILGEKITPKTGLAVALIFLGVLVLTI